MTNEQPLVCHRCNKSQTVTSEERFLLLNDNVHGNEHSSWTIYYDHEKRYPTWILLCNPCYVETIKESCEKIRDGTARCCRKMTKDTIPPSPLTVTEKCQMASELAPSDWLEEVLWPEYKESVGIFGHSQVAMDRTKTIPVWDALIWTQLCDSKGEVRKAVKNNGIMVNRKKVTDMNQILSEKDALPNIGAIVLERGKYSFGIVELC